MNLRTCVSAEGRFVYGIHRSRFRAGNFRQTTREADLGVLPDGRRHRNSGNFPTGEVHEPAADGVFEIPNALPFRGTTYIGKAWADARADAAASIRLPEAPDISLHGGHPDEEAAGQAIRCLPRPLQLALATTSTDARDLCCLARIACRLCMPADGGPPWGMAYVVRGDGRIEADIVDEALFDAVANNHYLPDAYKRVMVLRPGAQGGSEIVGEWHRPDSHVYEYLRRNSYIPWGHYAANMADDAVRYRLQDLKPADVTGMRHLYYQRSYVRLAEIVNVAVPVHGRVLSENELEHLRGSILDRLDGTRCIPFDRTLWGWNYGFDYAPSGYRLHASHQQVHQQFAMIPAEVDLPGGNGTMPAYACGDLVGDFVGRFRRETGRGFFECYQAAIVANRRIDGNDRRDRRLVVFEDDRVMLFVPKAQTSQWELQLMPKASVGGIVEADASMRRSLDRGIFNAVRVLGAMGARMITSIEYSKPFVGGDADQRLLMAFRPRLPESPGAFSEAQLRWINGHFPEDFAQACRWQLA
ncbi:MAG TPA: hypothetical protein VLT88_11955 [Desulfosarcina sp.]|nr:hypothetical protein [Desulfosarcina sp.]